MSSLIDIVRSRDARFQEHASPDGALVLQINARQRSLILQYGGTIDGLVNTTVQLAAVVSGALVGVSALGTPVYGTTFQDGWPVHQSVGGTPYVDFSEASVAGDPFGQNGGVPGFPLPTDFLKLILVSAVMNDSTIWPVDITRGVEQLENQRIGRLMAIVSGNRLVPIRPLAANNSNDVWAMPITAIRLSYVALPTVSSLGDTLMLPAVLLEALIAGMAEYLAMSTPTMSAGERAGFSTAARSAEKGVGDYSVDVAGMASPRSVIYRG